MGVLEKPEMIAKTIVIFGFSTLKFTTNAIYIYGKNCAYQCNYCSIHNVPL